MHINQRSYRITGTAPLIHHSEQLADPLNRHARGMKEITSKKKKTDADLMELAYREFLGGLYVNQSGAVCVPGQNIERMIRDAATKSKMGKTVLAGVIVTEDSFPLIFKHSKLTPEQLWKIGRTEESDCGTYELRRTCKVGVQRVVRTRPCFPEWSLEFTVQFDPELLNAKQIDEFVILAGRIIGLCDWRPKYGRFETEILK